MIIMASPQDWIAIDPQAVAENIREFGVYEAAKREVEIMLCKILHGDTRWVDITVEDMIPLLEEMHQGGLV